MELMDLNALRRLRKGLTIGRFRLVERLGLGGMAEVWTAKESSPEGEDGPIRALKFLHPSMAYDIHLQAMFRDEAAIATRLKHPNVVRVYELCEIDGLFFQVMEYVPGADLSAVIRQQVQSGQLVPWLLASYIIFQVCKGMASVHSQRDDDFELMGIVHRDLSPGNIIIGFDGAVKVIDFGVASGRNREVHTETGIIKGKMAYMAPEMAWSRDFDGRADIFSLGVVAWETLTGRRLFDVDASDPFVVERRPHPPSIHVFNPHVVEEVNTLVQSMLVADMSKRPANMEIVGRGWADILARHGLNEDVLRAKLEAWMGLVMVRPKTRTYPKSVPKPEQAALSGWVETSSVTHSQGIADSYLFEEPDPVVVRHEDRAEQTVIELAQLPEATVIEDGVDSSGQWWMEGSLRTDNVPQKSELRLSSSAFTAPLLEGGRAVVPLSDSALVGPNSDVLGALTEQGKMVSHSSGQITGPRTDAFSGGPNSEALLVGSHADALLVGSHADALLVGSHADALLVGSHADALLVGSHADALLVGSHADALLGETSDGDALLAGPDGDALLAGSRSDALLAGSRSDALLTGSRSDALMTGSRSDALLGNAPGFYDEDKKPPIDVSFSLPESGPHLHRVYENNKVPSHVNGSLPHFDTARTTRLPLDEYVLPAYGRLSRILSVFALGSLAVLIFLCGIAAAWILSFS